MVLLQLCGAGPLKSIWWMRKGSTLGPSLRASTPCAGRGDAPLHVAARAGRVEMAELLLSKGADVEAKNGARRGPGGMGLVRGLEVWQRLAGWKPLAYNLE